MIDYLHAVFPGWGVFPTEDAAWEWIETHDYDIETRRTYYKPFKITVNKFNEHKVETTSPEFSYRNQR